MTDGTLATVGFGLLALACAISAVLVVRARDLVHAVLWLAGTLLATAGLYALLDAPFLAAVQVLTYVGGVVTLMVFGVMVTRRHGNGPVEADGADEGRAAIVSVATFALLAAAIVQTKLPARDVIQGPTTQELARSLLDRHLVAFELASFLLLGAIVGAVVIARRKDDEREPADPGGGAP